MSNALKVFISIIAGIICTVCTFAGMIFLMKYDLQCWTLAVFGVSVVVFAFSYLFYDFLNEKR